MSAPNTWERFGWSLGCECWRSGDWFNFHMGCLVHNVVIAGALEMQRRYGRWDRVGYWEDKP